MQLEPVSRADLPSLPAQLGALRRASGLSYQTLAARTGLSRLTVAAAEGRADARLSSVVAIFQELGYELVPVPRAAVAAVRGFIASEGRLLGRAAGTEAPLSSTQRSFAEARERLGGDGGGIGGEGAGEGGL